MTGVSEVMKWKDDGVVTVAKSCPATTWPRVWGVMQFRKTDEVENGYQTRDVGVVLDHLWYALATGEKTDYTTWEGDNGVGKPLCTVVFRDFCDAARSLAITAGLRGCKWSEPRKPLREKIDTPHSVFGPE